MTNLCVYSAIFGNYDALRSPVEAWSGVEFVCFADQPASVPYWKIVVQPPDASSPVLAARRRKALPHVYLPDAEVTLWIDGYMRLIENPLDYVAEWLGDADAAAFPHPWRDTTEKEVLACIQGDKANPMRLLIQLETYKQDDFDPTEALQLYETGFLIRRNNPRTREFNQLWWENIVRHTHRDQVSFPYCVWKTGLKVKPIPDHQLRSDHYVDMSGMSTHHT